MKKFLLIMIISLNVFFMHAQQRNCGTMQHLDEIRNNNPSIDKEMDYQNQQIENWITKNQNSSKSSILTIPVVVHVIWNTSSENISDAQIYSQIDILNEDFRKQNSDASSVPSAFAGVAADCEIEFCLAVQDPNGNVTTGITRTQTSTSSFSGYTSMKYTSSGGINAWNTSDYLNIWVCDLASGLLGFATFPGGNANNDGVVCDYAYFGDIGTATYPYNLGRTATHEVGHWLNLYHIWGDSYCGNDYVSDTPTHEESNYGCPSFPHGSNCSGTGSNGEMFMNYMDYTNDACMYMFSSGQKNRMRATLTTSRSSLLSSSACQSVSLTLSGTVSNVSCYGFNDGSINLTVGGGGTPPYTYNWSNGATTQDISNLSGGPYSVTVTDAIGQSESSSFFVSSPSSPISISYTANAPSGPGLSDGSIIVNTSGGTNPYTYMWVGPNNYVSTSASINSLENGVYTLTVTDANGCVETSTIIVPQGQLTSLVVTANTTSIDCFGNNNGSIDMTVSGGLPPYYYFWSSGQTTEDINNLSAGTYTFIVADAAGQTFTSNYTINEPFELTTIYNVSNVSSPGGSDGSIDITPYGGTPPYLYYWSNGANTEDINNLSAGTYTLYLVDANNCYIGVSIDVLEDTGNQTCSGDLITGLFVSDIIDDRCVLNFDNMNTYDASGNQICRVDQIRIKYRPVGSSGWSQKNIASPTGYDANGICNSTQKTDKNLYGLTLDTEYEWEVKVWYCSGQTTGWAPGPNFTTAPECPNGGNFDAYGVNPTKARFTWDDSNGAFEFLRIKIRVDSISNPVASDFIQVGGAGVTYGTFTKDKNGLTPGETYRGQGRTWCNPNGGAYNSLGWGSFGVWTQPTNRIEGGESINNLDIYPNPSNDIFNISFTSEEIQDLRVRVLNIIGEELIVEDLQQFVGEYTKQITLGDNAKGIYLLEIKTNKELINNKLILK